MSAPRSRPTSNAAGSSSSSAAPPVPDDAARAQLAAALLGHDLSLEPLDPSLSVRSSAVLQPFRHLLRSRTPPSPLSAAGSFEVVETPEQLYTQVLPGEYSAYSVIESPSGRRASLAGSALWSTDGASTPAEPHQLGSGDENCLASEWGLDEVVSNLASPEASEHHHYGRSRLGSPVTGVGSIPAGRSSGDDDEAVEVLETRSMPDLEHSRPLSFTESILDSVERRLAASSSLHAASVPFRSATESTTHSGNDSSVPRIKIIERTPTQRKRLRQRLRTHSLGPTTGLSSLPSLADLSGDGSIGNLESPSSSARSGLAARSSLFLRPASDVQLRRRTPSQLLSPGFSSGRGSADLDCASAVRPDSRLSFQALTTSSDEPVPITDPEEQELLSPSEPRSSRAFTSRFDPLVIAAQKAELAKSRPAFANPVAGRRPEVVHLPVPLAGRPLSPPRRQRVEGPEPDSPGAAAGEAEGEGAPEEDAEEDFEEAPGLRKPLHPAGALYGRSLMDVMAERRAQLKAQQRAYVPGSDCRRAMFEWRSASAEQQGGPVNDAEEPASVVLLALLSAGGHGRDLRGDSPEKARAAAQSARVSIFGPDMVYQRELARARELEEQERAEREAVDRQRAEKEEKRRSKGKLVKAGKKRRSQLLLEQAGLQADKPLSALQAVGSQEGREWRAEGPQKVIDEDAPEWAPQTAYPISDLDRRNSLAPSLSMPRGLGAGLLNSVSNDELFVAVTDRKLAAGRVSDDEDDEDPGGRPRPISTFSRQLSTGAAGVASRRRSAFDMSSDEDEYDEDEDGKDEDNASTHSENTEAERNASPVSPSAARSPSGARSLPFPGEPSSHDHGSSSLRETEGDDDHQPLGAKYLHQSRALVPKLSENSESEDERPLAQRFLRSSTQQGPHHMPMHPSEVGTGDSRFMPFGSGNRPVPSGNKEEDEDEDEDKPLGARFSINPMMDEDDVPLAMRRLSLAPQRLEPSATLHALDDDGKTVSDDSDERPLGLKAARMDTMPAPAFTHHVPPPLAMASAFGPVAPVPPYTVGYGGALPIVPPDPQMQLAMAQMQMQAAMHQQAADPIERWRQEVSG